MSDPLVIRGSGHDFRVIKGLPVPDPLMSLVASELERVENRLERLEHRLEILESKEETTQRTAQPNGENGND